MIREREERGRERERVREFIIMNGTGRFDLVNVVCTVVNDYKFIYEE